MNTDKELPLLSELAEIRNKYHKLKKELEHEDKWSEKRKIKMMEEKNELKEEFKEVYDKFKVQFKD